MAVLLEFEKKLLSSLATDSVFCLPVFLFVPDLKDPLFFLLYSDFISNNEFLFLEREEE